MIGDRAISHVQAASWLAEWILAQRIDADRPYIVGITGIDASGKTTLADAVRQELEGRRSVVQIVRVDDFHRPRRQRYDERYPPADQYLRLSIDFDRLRDSVLKPITSEHRLNTRLTLLDLATDEWTVSRCFDIGPSTIVVVEGVFLLAPGVREYLDRIVFLSCSEEVALRRARLRDRHLLGPALEERYESKYLAAQRRFLHANPPERLASLILNVADDETFLIGADPVIKPDE